MVEGLLDVLKQQEDTLLPCLVLVFLAGIMVVCIVAKAIGKSLKHICSFLKVFFILVFGLLHDLFNKNNSENDHFVKMLIAWIKKKKKKEKKKKKRRKKETRAQHTPTSETRSKSVFKK